jgi:ATP-dependent RNA helicase DDX23/PRP28
VKSSEVPSSSSAPTPALQTPSATSNGNGTLPESSTPYVPPMSENDLSAVRDRYLGVTTKKRKIRKMNDRKFVFDWAEEEDTFASDSPIAVGANRQGAQVMFGRGRVGGMDDGGVVHGGASGDTGLADAMERRKAAKSGLDERHWSEKPLSEMKERDWRIFREDFSIAARGMCIPPGYPNVHSDLTPAS